MVQFVLADVMYAFPFSFIKLMTLLIASLYSAIIFIYLVVSSLWGRSVSEMASSDSVISLWCLLICQLPICNKRFLFWLAYNSTRSSFWVLDSLSQLHITPNIKLTVNFISLKWWYIKKYFFDNFCMNLSILTPVIDN